MVTGRDDTWKCDHCGHSNNDAGTKWVVCAICGGGDFTKTATEGRS